MLIEGGGADISLSFTLSLSALVSLLVSVLSLSLVGYRFPLVRQRRDETREKLTQTIGAVRRFRDVSCSYWDDSSRGEGELLNACEDYISEIYALKRRYKIYVTLEEADILKLKGAATLHESFLDAKRPPSEQIKAQIKAKIRDESRMLIETLEDRFSAEYNG